MGVTQSMSRVNWKPSEEQYLVENHATKSGTECAKHLKRSVNSVKGRLGLMRRRGIIPYCKKDAIQPEQRYGAEVVTFLRQNYVQYGSRYCMDKLKISLRTVRNAAAALGLKLTRDSGRSVHSYTLNEAVLVQPTKEFAYFLGFLWGDGCLHDDGSCVYMSCVEADLLTLAPIFESFAEWQYSTIPASRKRGVSRQERLTMTLCSLPLREFLTQQGYENKKAHAPDQILAWLPPELVRYWWRGMFDADGHITFTTEGVYNETHSFSLTSNHFQDWGFFETLCEKLGTSPRVARIHREETGHKNSRACLDTEDSHRFLHFVYSDYDYIGLARKYLVYLRLHRYMQFKAANPYLYPTRWQLKGQKQMWEIEI